MSDQKSDDFRNEWFESSLEELFPPLARGPQQAAHALFDRNRLQGVYLVPNQRTRQALQQHYLATSEQSVAASPIIYTPDQWLEYLFDKLCLYSPDATNTVPNLISRRAVEGFFLSELEKKDLALNNLRGLASQLTESWRIYVHWLVEPADLRNSDRQEVQLFSELVISLLTHCTEQNVITKDQLASYLCKRIEGLKALLPASILLYGIDELTPLQKRWLVSLAKTGIDIASYYPAVDNAEAKKVALGEVSQAIKAAARYAKSRMLEEPEKKLAIVIPDLAQRTAEVHQIFSSTFHPEEYLPEQPIDKPAYNVSAGLSLAEVPAIEALLALMSMDHRQLSAEDLIFIVNSGFFGWRDAQGKEVKSEAVAPLIESLQRENYRWSLSGLKQWVAGSKVQHPAVSELLLPRLEALESLPRGGSFLSWRRDLAEWIKLWQWPAMTVTENDSWYQKFWQQVDEVAVQEKELRQLNPTAKGKSRGVERIHILKENLNQTLWQMPSNRSQVQVLGVLEAAGLCFDEAVLIGFHQGNWPAAARPSAFLPWPLQVSRNMPGSSAKRETEYAKSLTQSLLHSAKKVWVVETQFDKEQPLSPSPLFDGIALAPNHGLRVEATPIDKDDQKNIERQRLPIALRIADQPLAKQYIPRQVATGQLSAWSQCPFKFFAGSLLHLRQLQTSQLHFSPLVRGNWVHKSLEMMWQKLTSQEALLRLSESELSDLIHDSVQQAQERLGIAYLGLPEGLVSLVGERLCELLDSWFLLEKQRPAFSRVLCEQSYELRLNELTIRVRLDRIDFDSQQGMTVIDYKTGTCSVTDWFGERPQELQMPVYAMVMKTAGIKQLGYGQIKHNAVEATLVSIEQSVNEVAMQKLSVEGEKQEPVFKRFGPESQASLIDYWEATLHRLADYFSAGHFPVSPVNRKACTYCDYSNLCRTDYLDEQLAEISGGTV